MTWGTPVEVETKNRIKVSVAAYAYEFMGESIMTDHEFDDLSLKINKNLQTGNKVMDNFFKKDFMPDTGMWIRSHPELNKIIKIYNTFYKDKK